MLLLLTLFTLGLVLLDTPPNTSMMPNIDWASDVLPQIQSLMGNGIILGALISVAALAVVVFGGRGLISIFFKRD